LLRSNVRFEGENMAEGKSLDGLSTSELKGVIEAQVQEASEWTPINKRRKIRSDLDEIVSEFERRLKTMDMSRMSIEDKKLMELMLSFDEDEWWLIEEEYDEDEEYNEDTAPSRYCMFCEAWQYVGDPNVLEHEEECPVLRLGMILYHIDFSKIDYRRKEVQI